MHCNRLRHRGALAAFYLLIFVSKTEELKREVTVFRFDGWESFALHAVAVLTDLLLLISINRWITEKRQNRYELTPMRIIRREQRHGPVCFAEGSGRYLRTCSGKPNISHSFYRYPQRPLFWAARDVVYVGYQITMHLWEYPHKYDDHRIDY